MARQQYLIIAAWTGTITVGILLTDQAKEYFQNALVDTANTRDMHIPRLVRQCSHYLHVMFKFAKSLRVCIQYCDNVCMYELCATLIQH